MSKRPKLKPDAALAEWCKALAQITTPVDVVPPGWQTAQQLAAKTKVPVPTLQQKLKRLVAAGQAERKMFRVRLTKYTRPVPHYCLK
jgi:hypothetical protein